MNEEKVEEGVFIQEKPETVQEYQPESKEGDE